MAKLSLLTAATLFICGSVGWAETLPYGYLIRCQLGHSDNGTCDNFEDLEGATA